MTTRRSGARRWARAGTALLAVAVALTTATACSSGKITQTGSQVAAIPGADATVGDIALRGVMIAYSGPEGYPIGANAPLIVRIFNNGLTPVTLVGASASANATRVELVTGGGGAPPAEPSPTPDPSATPDPTAGPGATPEPTPTPAAEPVDEAFAVEIKPATYELLVPGQDRYLQLVDLTAPLRPGSTVKVTFRIDAGSTTHTVELTVPVAPPETEVPRATGDVPAPAHE